MTIIREMPIKPEFNQNIDGCGANIGVSSKPSLRSRVNSVAKTSFEKAKSAAQTTLNGASTAYTYASKVKCIGTKTLQIIQVTAPPASKTARKIGRVVRHLKIFQVIEIPLNLYNATVELTRIPFYLRDKDWEGVGLCLSSIMLLMGDTLDAAITVADLISIIESNPVVSAIGQVLVPLGMALVAASSAIKGYKLATTAVELHKANKMLKKNAAPEDVENYITKLAGITDKDFRRIEFRLSRKKKLKNNPEKYQKQLEKEKAKLLRLKTNRLQRRANRKAVKALNMIIDENGKIAENADIEKAMKQLKTSLIQTTCVHSANILTNMVILTGLSLTFAPIPPVVPIVTILAGSVAKLGIMVSDQFILDRLIRRMV
jgi:hypothetical protein